MQTMLVAYVMKTHMKGGAKTMPDIYEDQPQRWRLVAPVAAALAGIGLFAAALGNLPA